MRILQRLALKVPIMRLVYNNKKSLDCFTSFSFLVFIRAERFTTQGTCKKEDRKKPISKLSTLTALNFSVTMKFFSSLALENQFGIFFIGKLIFTAFLLFVSTFKQLLICMSSLFYWLPSTGVHKHCQKLYHNAPQAMKRESSCTGMHHVSWEQPQLK